MNRTLPEQRLAPANRGSRQRGLRSNSEKSGPIFSMIGSSGSGFFDQPQAVHVA